MSSKKPPTDRCTGHCCQNFHLPLSPDDLDRGYAQWKSGGKQITMSGATPPPVWQDIHLIAPMVVWLGPDATRPKQINPRDSILLGEVDPAGHRYRCKHFDANEKLCTIYEIRPAMCRNYPGGKPCNYASCTWKKRKAKKETRLEQQARKRRLLAEIKEGAK